MGHKKMCLQCRVALNITSEDLKQKAFSCQHCGKTMIRMPHRFRPPKKSDDKKWEVVSLLVDNGFYYQHIYQDGLSEHNTRLHNNYTEYPTNMRDAREFVEKYKKYARK